MARLGYNKNFSGYVAQLIRENCKALGIELGVEDQVEKPAPGHQLNEPPGHYPGPGARARRDSSPKR